MTQIKTFLKLIYSENISHSRLKSLIGGWDNSFLPGKIRTFLFKFYNNILGLNSRVAKFNVDTDPSCTFCSLQNHRPAEKETFAHLFFLCNTTNNIIREFFNRYFTIEPPNCEIFFCGNISVNEETNKPFQLAMDILHYHIWLNKLEKKIPVISYIFNEVNDTMGYIYKASPKAEQLAESCYFFRHGRE